MGRKTGRNTKIECELGTVFFPMSELTSVSTPTLEVNRTFSTSATYLSDQEKLQPIVKLDGISNGFTLTPSDSVDEIAYSAGKGYLKGVDFSVTAGTITVDGRPVVAGQTIVSALSIDDTGTVIVTEGSEGAANDIRGTAGAKPFIPVDEVLIGYITLTSVAAAIITSDEVDSETKERTILPSYEVIYHDGDRDNQTDMGVIRFSAKLSTIHTGSVCRNVFASYYEPEFEQLSDVKDFSLAEEVGTIKSKAYGEKSEQTSLGSESWSGSGSAYWTNVNDILSLLKNTKRWVKYYPDDSELGHWVGRAVIKVSRSMPTDDVLSASITIDGSGTLYTKST